MPFFVNMNLQHQKKRKSKIEKIVEKLKNIAYIIKQKNEIFKEEKAVEKPQVVNILNMDKN